MEPKTVTTELEFADRTVVAIRGELDLANTNLLQDHLADLAAAGRRHFVVNLEAVTSIDSTGLNALAGVLYRIRDVRGSLRLVCSSERLRGLLDVTGLAAVLPVHHSVAAALAADLTDERRRAPSSTGPGGKLRASDPAQGM